jgi:hypothetical protein
LRQFTYLWIKNGCIIPLTLMILWNLHFKDPAIITIETVIKFTTVNMLFSKVDSFTPLDRTPVEIRQEFVVKLKIKTDENTAF